MRFRSRATILLAISPRRSNSFFTAGLMVSNCFAFTPDSGIEKATVLPPAPWCPECIVGRGPDDVHIPADPLEREVVEDDALRVIQLDYSYLDVMTLLGAYDMSVASGAVTCVSSKGHNTYPEQWVLGTLDRLDMRRLFCSPIRNLPLRVFCEQSRIDD